MRRTLVCSSTTLLLSRMHCTVLVLSPDMEEDISDIMMTKHERQMTDRGWHTVQNLAGQRKKLIGMPSVIALLTQKRRENSRQNQLSSFTFYALFY